MPTTVKVTKEMILDTAFEIVREVGMDALNNRDIAKRLNCSIRPIYYQFENVSNMQQELIKKIEEYFYEFLMANVNDDLPKYKQVGINYIRFAREEKEFFKILFMTKNDLSPLSFITKDNEYFRKLEKIIHFSTELSDDELKTFHVRMWIFTHGIACLVASDTCMLKEQQISDLLSYEFQALMLLEENPNNKWILQNGKFIKDIK